MGRRRPIDEADPRRRVDDVPTRGLLEDDRRRFDAREAGPLRFPRDRCARAEEPLDPDRDWLGCRHVLLEGEPALVHDEGRLALCAACERLAKDRFEGSYDRLAEADLNGELDGPLLHGFHASHVGSLPRARRRG